MKRMSGRELMSERSTDKKTNARERDDIRDKIMTAKIMLRRELQFKKTRNHAQMRNGVREERRKNIFAHTYIGT